MRKKEFLCFLILITFLTVKAFAQADINQFDNNGKKTGYWIVKDGNIKVYEGTFKDGHPIGEFKRFYNDNTLRSKLLYNDSGTEAYAYFYHPNGFIASEGKYINQLKEGLWKFYSAYSEGYMISQEEYSKNLKNGSAAKYYHEGKIAEKLIYVNDRRNGEWTQYFANGVLALKANYLNGNLNGSFQTWFENGKKQISGEYKNNLKDGHWIIYKDDGTEKYEMDYIAGKTENRQMEIDEANLIDSLERNKGKIPDPEKTGTLW